MRAIPGRLRGVGLVGEIDRVGDEDLGTQDACDPRELSQGAISEQAVSGEGPKWGRLK